MLEFNIYNKFSINYKSAKITKFWFDTNYWRLFWSIAKRWLFSNLYFQLDAEGGAVLMVASGAFSNPSRVVRYPKFPFCALSPPSSWSFSRFVFLFLFWAFNLRFFFHFNNYKVLGEKRRTSGFWYITFPRRHWMIQIDRAYIAYCFLHLLSLQRYLLRF